MTGGFTINWLYVVLTLLLFWQVVRTDQSLTTWATLLKEYDDGEFNRSDRAWHNRLIARARRYAAYDLLSAVALFGLFFFV